MGFEQHLRKRPQGSQSIILLLLLAVVISGVRLQQTIRYIKRQAGTSRIGIRSTHITGIFPTTIERECSGILVSPDFDDCAHSVQWRNAKFGVVVTIIGLGFIFTVGFTFMSCMRREKARRLTRFYDATVASGELYPATRKKAAGNDLETALTTNHQNVVRTHPTTNSRQTKNTAPELITLDGVNDGWTLWIYERAGISVSNHLPVCIGNSH